MELAGMVLNDSLHNPQPQAGPLFPFGGYKWLKNAASHLFRDTRTRIRNQDAHPAMQVVVPRNMAAADPQFSSICHRIAGIDHQVGKHLADLIGGDYRIW